MSQFEIRTNRASLCASRPKHHTLTVLKGPQGQKRPADVIGAAVLVGKIATGGEQDCPPKPKSSEVGSVDGKARARKLTHRERSKFAKTAANRRWGQKADPEQENAG